jgi:hypothetical protein
MNMEKIMAGNRNILRDSVSVAVNFGGLTSGTLASPGSNLSGLTMRDKKREDIRR